MKAPGGAVVCLFAAAVGELVVAAGTLTLLPGLQLELTVQSERDSVAEYSSLESAVSSLQGCVWAYAATGVITLVLAVLAWWRGGTVGMRAAAALSLIPYAVFYLVFGVLGWSSLDEWYAQLPGRISDHLHGTLYSDMIRLLAGAAGLLYLVGVALLFLAAPSLREGEGCEGGTPDELAGDAVIDAQGEGAAVRGWRKRRAGWAAMCLLAASVCKLVIAVVAFVLPIVLQREMAARPVVKGNLQWYMWGYTAAVVITLAVAVLAWRRGGTAGVRAVAALSLAPYTAFCLYYGPLLVGIEALEDVPRYSDMVLWLTGVAGLLYLTGTILLFFTKPNVRQAHRVEVSSET
ncbi:hypothetical protein [Streptosporangium sp. NPDC002607]